MHRIVTLLALLSLSFDTLAIDSIQLGSIEIANFDSPLTFTAPIKSELEAYLELGDSLSEQDVTIISTTDDVYRVSIQLETSMSISAEGPHLDLTDWKHCTTGWLAATVVDQSTFKLPNFNKVNTDCFPEVTLEEIKAEVFTQGGQSWIDVLEEYGGRYDPTTIYLSMARIKIEKKVSSKWQQLTIIKVSIPMGC